MEISKELASSVLGLNVAYTERCEHRDNIIGIWADMNTKPIKEINIYEFAFKCKEWAISKNYSLMSRQAREYDLCPRLTYKQVGICNILINDSPDVSKNILIENTEIEAIIKACEWILERSKCQN